MYTYTIDFNKENAEKAKTLIEENVIPYIKEKHGNNPNVYLIIKISAVYLLKEFLKESSENFEHFIENPSEAYAFVDKFIEYGLENYDDFINGFVINNSEQHELMMDFTNLYKKNGGF
jgi:hypothetical protein